MARAKYILFLISVSISIYAVPQIERSLDWQSRLNVEHELVGKIWSSKRQEFITVDEFTSSIEESRYLILGEKHDNPDHHLLQLSIINHLVSRDLLSLVAFEMMDTSSQNLLDEIHLVNMDNQESLKEYLKWDEEGWNWSYYGPIIYSAYSSKVALAASNLTDSKMMELYGLQELPPELDIFDELIMDRLVQDIDESHCGLLPESQFPAMVRVQQGRDYSMAQSLVSNKGEQINVLIAGNYHARKDLGVPKYLVANDSELTNSTIVSVSFVEVVPDETDPASYLQDLNDVAPHDFLWFTPVVSEQDYCSSLRQQ